MTRAVLPFMPQARSGRILNISSIGGYRGVAGFGVYSSTKIALKGWSKALNDELAPIGIHVTVVEPGYFRTDFLESSSLSVSGNVICDYAETVGKMHIVAASLSHNQHGDPQRLAEVLIAFTDAPNPPVRLSLGSGTVAAIFSEWRAMSFSTDFAANE
ncbi:short subunit dehydrogenase [Rhizobium sp. PP-F2F-G38]|nr:short subunit dehydrogenase [Rhizobium sp. PP-F2F-G38]TCP80711.1 short subunit dehydrogenase [Rhizobium sp. PP-CC-2G-626]TCQ19356.1 short subunit dehydrogenase [Rhizobium sp. PP-CC-3G-465]